MAPLSCTISVADVQPGASAPPLPTWCDPTRRRWRHAGWRAARWLTAAAATRSRASCSSSAVSPWPARPRRGRCAAQSGWRARPRAPPGGQPDRTSLDADGILAEGAVQQPADLEAADAEALADLVLGQVEAVVELRGAKHEPCVARATSPATRGGVAIVMRNRADGCSSARSVRARRSHVKGPLVMAVRRCRMRPFPDVTDPEFD